MWRRFLYASPASGPYAGRRLPDKARLALDLFGGIDILVQNAGITQRSLVKNTDPAVYRTLMELNYFAPVALTKAVLPPCWRRRAATS